MKNIRLIAVMIVVSLVVLAGGLLQEAAAQWKPEKPINLIVPWGRGGRPIVLRGLMLALLKRLWGRRL